MIGIDDEHKEPLLKFQRAGKHFRNIFAEDSISCLKVHRNFICVGTYQGSVHLMSLQGEYKRKLHTHFKKVNDISIDQDGQVKKCL